MLAIPRKQRAMVRKGIKEELRAEIDDDVGRHYDMYSESLRNLGTPVFSRRYLEILQGRVRRAPATSSRSSRAIARWRAC